jgi:2-(1,2-epoxy-1,2-dihydrophenyl)acetyl-CoA isomerase
MDELMATANVSLSVEGDGVAVLELRRPPNNFLSPALVAEIAEALELADADDRCRAVVLCSQGKHFCAGAVLGGNGSAPRGPGGRHLYDEALRIFACQTPIVAAIQGAATGGGLGLALAADLRIAGEGARLWANFAVLGFHHGFGLSATLPVAVGAHQATRILMEARRLSGADAARIGLVDAVVADADLRHEALTWAGRLAANAPLAIGSIRRTMRGDLYHRVEEAMRHERMEQERLAATADFAEGVAAMAERRSPHFTGR